MIVLHAGVCEQQLYFWGEIAIAEQTHPARRGQPPKKQRVLPYDAGLEQLGTALAVRESHSREVRRGVAVPLAAHRSGYAAWPPVR